MSIDSYETPEREALLHAVAARSARAVIGRERITHAVASGGFLAAAAALAVVAPWQRPSPVWPVYVAALAAQFGFDLAATTGRCWFAERIRPSVQLPLVAWIYVVDAGLASVGLVLASQAVVLPGLVLLALPLIGILALFARER